MQELNQKNTHNLLVITEFSLYKKKKKGMVLHTITYCQQKENQCKTMNVTYKIILTFQGQFVFMNK